MTTIYLAGDSTVQNYQANSPQGGWGEFLQSYLSEDVQVVNRAIGGRSSKTFVEEGRLAAILEVIKKGDWLFVQMGHNDSSKDKPERYTDPYTTYKQYLRMYIEGARQKEATPLLITPVARLHYENGVFLNDFPDYCIAMKQLAEEEHVLLIDLMNKSLQHFAEKGYSDIFKYFMISENVNDYTHFTKKGAREIAKLVSSGMQELGLPFVKETV
ncbi:rhamnogalacturonan acetylesterase [Bacillus sonorensis]|mgnify:FL=1|uniref:Rhamnogalacturonan acetylesterase YesY n=2 Tax=Bacillus sonorensis TaxID=119858 RepID=M5PDE6_9BACI|nr:MULTISPECIES: rhamnogalacturonan acetylesterase [Bacillus]TWK73015.1 putative rhamnogalacturonan acetylesterase YesY [Bacillus paralicheniformis]ASB89977.1 Rhamnogalacturonan acetylesterase [Bacillus sonorensis]EME74650.1 rhamnogalacturonan acetylesterase YesY [Bacillus sonorensis L12]MCF7619227.1 rhamnogalacturonan acetylesterase [Bacillus sonorensis]MCY8271885.1 rhamnogalacturonan acetylesterase [Bacillus sonorensis]